VTAGLAVDLTTHTTATAVITEPDPEVGSTPETLPTQRSATTRPDKLTRIGGIGPKIALALNAAGITTFAELAAADESLLRAAITGAGLRLAPSLSTWPKQAQALLESEGRA
jgi:predicted flap endonuclease-1-like 5' DNA nuclease